MSHLNMKREERVKAQIIDMEEGKREHRKSHETSLGGISLNRLAETFERYDKTNGNCVDTKYDKKINLNSLGRSLSMLSDGKVVAKTEKEKLVRSEREQDDNHAAGLFSRLPKENSKELKSRNSNII